MSVAHCPGSCGELLQGWILGSEKLISCPIDWYSTVEILNGKAHQFTERPLMRQALRATLKHLKISDDFHDSLAIRFHSTLPIAKGMASSTADIAATILAVARHFHTSLSEQEIASLCVQLEPTDSTIFRQLTLFDHNHGHMHTQFDWTPNLHILILENESELNTSVYHQIDRTNKLQTAQKDLQKAFDLFEQSIQQKDVRLMGEASTLSAIASQTILPKPMFSAIRHFAEKYQLTGLNVAHSGTVVGLLMDEHRIDIEKISAELKLTEIQHYYPQQHLVKLISGGLN